MDIRELEKGKNISIWGAGIFGKKVFSFYKNKVNVVSFLDSNENKQGQMLFGIPIRKWDPSDKSSLVVIATEHWREIIPTLVEKGWKIFKDFVVVDFLWNSLPDSYWLIHEHYQCMGAWDKEDWERYKCGKKLVVFHGGCHEFQAGAFVALHPYFQKEYKMIWVPHEAMISRDIYAPQVVELAESYVNDNTFLSQIDLFFYCEQWRDWVMSNDMIMDQLSPQCRKITLPLLMFYGYFIQCGSTEKSQHVTKELYHFRFPDYCVRALWRKGHTEEEILELIQKDDFYSKRKVENFYNLSIRMFRSAEKGADIKIGDFVEKNGKKEQLFLDPTHPVNKLFIEEADRILKLLFPNIDCSLNDIYDEDILSYIVPPLTARALPIYPSVIKALGLPACRKNFRVNSTSGFIDFLNFEEYIREYIRTDLKEENTIINKIGGETNG